MVKECNKSICTSYGLHLTDCISTTPLLVSGEGGFASPWLMETPLIINKLNKLSKITHQSSRCLKLVSGSPLQSPQAYVQSSRCVLQVHRSVPHPVLQLHLNSRRSSSGAGGWSVFRGTKEPSMFLHPHSSGFICPAFPFHSWTSKNTRRLWYRAAANVGGKLFAST